MTAIAAADRDTVLFEGGADFEAYHKAQAWCRERGISVGAMQAGSPTGLMARDIVISKWRNMSPAQRAALDGTLRGDFRHGPVRLAIRRDVLPQAGGK